MPAAITTKLTLVSALLLPSVLVNPAHADIFISEYLEGSGNNKAIELYNPADTDISLGQYSLSMFNNGATKATKTIRLTGTIASKGTFVLVDDGAVSALKQLANQSMGGSNFNGDDVVALYKDNVLIDVFGKLGDKPAGGAWGSGVKSANQTLVRLPGISSGDINPNDAFDPAIEWQSLGNDVFSNIGQHNFSGGGGGGGGGGDDTDPTPPVDNIGLCGDDASRIHAIQGNGAASPMVGNTVIVEAIVTQASSGLNGFFVQEELSHYDNDPATSEAIFVSQATALPFPSVGSKVRVKGKVEEFFGRTQLTRNSDVVNCGSAELPAPVSLSLPWATLDAAEAYEGMLVNFRQALVVADHSKLVQFGEVRLASARHVTPTNRFRPNSPQAIALAEQQKRDRIILDDMQSGSKPSVIPFPAPGMSMQNPVRLGSSVSNLTGVLDYAFSAYRLNPIHSVQFNDNERTSGPQLQRRGNLTVASFNVLNYFNGNGSGGGFPTPRGATNAAEFARQADKIVDALVNMNADIVGLMEIENDGYGERSAIADLVNRLNAELGAGTYRFISASGTGQLGGDEITVGLIYKPASVALVGNAATTADGIFAMGNRQPLAQSFRDKQSNEVFTLVVNHFKSKAGCGNASGPDRDLGDGQGCWNATRVAAATELQAWLSRHPTGVTDPDVLIMGDLNAYAKEDPIITLQGKGFVDLVEKFNGDKGYSYHFDTTGESGYLDHALASSSLVSQVTDTKEWHINADEIELFDYNLEGKTPSQQQDFYAPTAYRSSDHDPVLVELKLQGQLLGDLDGNGAIDSRDVSLFNQWLRSGQPLGMQYDFNQDGVVNSLDARALAARCSLPRCAILN